VRIIRLMTILLCFFVIAPYVLNYLILPGQRHPNADYFKGEWFNRVQTSDGIKYETLDRWSHYYGKHGCEPEYDNCPYRGILGQYHLLYDYIREPKPCPIKLLKVL
jgi:hypothetical protein